MNRLALWLDNPILVKHVRSRLRRAQAIPSALLVLILCILIAWGGWMLNGFETGAVL